MFVDVDVVVVAIVIVVQLYYIYQLEHACSSFNPQRALHVFFFLDHSAKPNHP